MRSVIFPEGYFPGEDGLVSELAKKEGTAQSVLQECNDNSELIYVQFQEYKEGKPVVDGRGRPVLVPTNMSYLRIKKALRGKKAVSFVTVDNFRKQYIVIISEPKIVVVPFVAECDDGKIVFIGEGFNDPRKGNRVEQKMKITVCASAVLSTRHKEKVSLIFPCGTYAEAEDLSERLKETMGGGKIVLVSGMYLPEILPNKSVGFEVEKMNVVVNNYVLFDDFFEDVAELIPRIKSWKDVAIWRDVSTSEPFYTQEVNELLMFNVCYVKSGRAVFNLILSGIASTAKTSCITEYARIFGDDGRVVQAQGATTKGLIPSFGDGIAKTGYIASSGFLKVVDEIFRHVSVQHENQNMNNITGAIGAYLSRLLPLLTRRMQNYPSGSNDNFSVQMTASLLATDNLREEVRVALSNQVEKDPAVLRRFTMVYLNEDDWHKIKTASVVPSDDEVHGYIDSIWLDKYGYSVNKLKRFAMWFRQEVKNVRADSARCLSIADSVVGHELQRLVGGSIDFKMMERVNWFGRKLDFVDHVRALVECSALMREVYAMNEQQLPKNVKVIDDDYVAAERIFKRIINDCMFLFSNNLATLLLRDDSGDFVHGVKRV